MILKKIISVFLSICICLCLFTPVCFADNSVASDHTHNWVKQKIHSYSLEYNGIAFGIDVYKCSDCVLYLHKMLFLGYEVPIVRASPDTALGSEAAAMCAQALIAVFGKEWYATKFEAGGGSASPGGVGRNPAGYAGEGTPSYNVDGDLFVLAQPIFYATGDEEKTPVGSGRITFRIGSIDFSCPSLSYQNVDSNIQYFYFSGKDSPYQVAWSFICPVDGVYFINDKTRISSSPEINRYIQKFSYKCKSGDKIYLYHNYSENGFGVKLNPNSSLTIKLDSIPVKCIPDKPSVTKNTNITINNNTWNGNIYVDNINKLTYIYPQYTVNNETKISNNPIIYNEETKQYYTYDSVTNNYYYITYGDPAPTPTPTPTPDPGGSTPGPDNPSPSPSPSTAPGGSSDKETGGNSFFNFIFGFGSDTGKDENGKKGIIWSLISLLVSCVTFVVGMGTAYSYLFPFLPPGLCTTIHICVLVLFLFAVIKFIRSFI